MDKQDKGINKAATAGLKYCLLKTFLISTCNEPEADAGPTAEEPLARPTNGSAHWMHRLAARTRFWAWTKQELGLTEDQVHDILGVASMYEYPGTMVQAKADIEEALACGYLENEARTDAEAHETQP
jgi:hypothetical protein